MRILVAEDEYAVAESIGALLVDEGHELSYAADGAEALEKMRAACPDLLLLDLMMPVMDGAATLSAIAKDPALAAVRIVLMSAAPESTLRRIVEAVQLPVIVLRKPFSLEALLAAIETTKRARD